MKYTYKEIVYEVYGANTIKRTDENGDTAWIPTDPANSDYQRYLRWLEDPEADESGTL